MTDSKNEENVVPLLRPDAVGSCPTCRKPLVHAYRPFCSKRCADVDLGNWFTESYSVPSSSPYGDDDD